MSGALYGHLLNTVDALRDAADQVQVLTEQFDTLPTAPRYMICERALKLLP